MKKLIYLFLVIGILSCGSDDTPQSTTCNVPSSINNSDSTEDSVTLSWVGNGDSFEIEFGISGFQFGTDEGQKIFTSSNQKVITNLVANTNYQFYIRTSCTDDNFSNWEGPFEASTSHGECPNAIDVYENMITDTTALIIWDYPNNSIETPTSSKIEYGVSGFIVGNGTLLTTSDREFQLDNLTPSTSYEYYITSVCNSFDGTSGPYSFTTEATCQKPYGLQFYDITPCGFSVYWQTNETSSEIEYGVSGFTLGTGTVANTSSQNYTLTGLDSNTTYEVYVKSNCGSDGYSEYSEPLVVTTSAINTHLGTYYYESITDSVFGTSVFGTPHNVQITEVSTNVRSINVNYVGTESINFEFELTCDGKILVTPNQVTTGQCTTGSGFIELGPSPNIQNYNVNSDYVIEFTFLELYNDTAACGISNSPVTIRLTKI